MKSFINEDIASLLMLRKLKCLMTILWVPIIRNAKSDENTAIANHSRSVRSKPIIGWNCQRE